MFKIYDGRDQFFQWDLNRKLIVNDPTVKQVHFCNKTDNCSLVVEVYEEDGLYLANVPNILLQSDWNIRVYGYDAEYTKHYAVYKVQSRTKPTDYVYTETEVKNWEDLEKRIKELENASGSDCYSKEETDELLLDKVDKVEGKGLSTNDFTDELKSKVENNTFDYYAEDVNYFYLADRYENNGIYLLHGEEEGYHTYAILAINGGGYDVKNKTLLELDTGNIYKISQHNQDILDEDGNQILDGDGAPKQETVWEENWTKVSVSQRDLAKYVSTETFNDTIGDIQSLLDNTISLADSYIGEVTE